MRAFAMLSVLSIAGCGGPRIDSHSASAMQHDQAEWDHSVEAEAHAKQATPSTCTPELGACWSSGRNLTESHARAAREHEEVATGHVLASGTLRDAERRACTGLADADRATSPFGHTGDIASVAPLLERHLGGTSSYERRVGAIITFRPIPGMTAEWFQRLVDCHLAHVAALGHEVPDMPNCPLVPRGAMAAVRTAGNGFAVEIRADDATVAAEILARAELLQPKAASKP